VFRFATDDGFDEIGKIRLGATLPERRERNENVRLCRYLYLTSRRKKTKVHERVTDGVVGTTRLETGSLPLG
jgi:hypothetical protein